MTANENNIIKKQQHHIEFMCVQQVK